MQMIVDHASLAEYNRVLVFLLTVQRAKFMLDRAPRLAAHALLHTELHHFVSNLQVWRSTLAPASYTPPCLFCHGVAKGWTTRATVEPCTSMNATTEHQGRAVASSLR
jgi:hypothetical protein